MPIVITRLALKGEGERKRERKNAKEIDISSYKPG
jgi:hypothetical protein